MPKSRLQQRLVDALVATGRGTIVQSRSRKYVTLERPEIPGAPNSEETTAENMSKWGALVRTALPVAKGEMVTVAEREGRYKSRAEIRNVTIGADGLVRLNLLFLDGSVPDELLPPTPPEPAASTT